VNDSFWWHILITISAWRPPSPPFPRYDDRWFGVYYTRANIYEEPIGHSIKVLRFNIIWNISRHFVHVYFVIMPFWSGVQDYAYEIPVAALIGIIGGVLVCLLVYVGRTKMKQWKRSISISLAVALVICSAVAFGAGCWYIQSVWDPNADIDSQDVLWLVTFFAWLCVGLLLHIAVWRYTRRHALMEEAALLESTSSSDGVAALQGSGTSSTMSPARQGRFPTQLFHPQHFMGVTAETMTGSIEKQLRASEGSGVNTNESNTTENQEGQGDTGVGESVSESEPLASPEPHREGEETAKDGNADHRKDNEEVDYEYGDGDDGDVDKEETVTTCSLLMGKCCCCCSRCGCVGYQVDKPERPGLEKCFFYFKQIVWAAASALCLYLTVVNLGATYQADRTMERLPFAYEVLYRGQNEGPVCALNLTTDQIDAGPYSLDNLPPAETKTFPNASAALAEGWTVAHCSRT